MREGLAKESKIIKEYLASMHENGHKDIKVERSGLVVDVKNVFLAASPDGLVNDPSHDPAKGMIELNCIKLREGETLWDALVRRRICVNKNGT